METALHHTYTVPNASCKIPEHEFFLRGCKQCVSAHFEAFDKRDVTSARTILLAPKVGMVLSIGAGEKSQTKG